MAEKAKTAAEILAGMSPEERAALLAQASAKSPKAVKAPAVEIGGNRYTLSARKTTEGKSRGWIGRFKIELPDPGTGELARCQVNVDVYVVGSNGKPRKGTE